MIIMKSRTRGAAVATLITVFALLLFVAFKPFQPSVPVAITNYRQAAERSVPSFPIVERAARSIREESGDEGIIEFLTRHIQSYPQDTNNGYYLTVIGEMYLSIDADALARQYFRRALYSYPDIVVRSVPVHRVAINRLLDLVEEPRERIEYLRYLQDRYPDSIDTGLTAYYLAQAYEADARWPEAYENYRVFLQYPETQVPGAPNAHQKITRRLAFYDSERDWTYEDLDVLVTRIKNALWAQNPSALLRNRARQNFFTMSWKQEIDDANSEIPTFDIAIFLRRSKVRFSEELDISSNANEAFLRTWGWSYRIPTWYLYFRRVDFPEDPKIHGNWEWAGIYFGESM